jgi:hypothetical protein
MKGWTIYRIYAQDIVVEERYTGPEEDDHYWPPTSTPMLRVHMVITLLLHWSMISGHIVTSSQLSELTSDVIEAYVGRLDGCLGSYSTISHVTCLTRPDPTAWS